MSTDKMNLQLKAKLDELIEALEKGSATGDKLAIIGVSLAIIEIIVGVVMPLLFG